MHPRSASSPALHHQPLPIASTLVSAVLHGSLVAALLVSAAAWRDSQPKTYIVNLVPAVAAFGTREGRPVSLPPRTEEPAPRPAATSPTELPRRAPDMPPRTEVPLRESLGLPDRSLPARAPAPPRPGEKELPTVAHATPSIATGLSTASAAPQPSAPPAPLGRPSGSAVGSGALTLNVSDFPFAWYLQTIQRKISERWAPPLTSASGQQAIVIFEIGRDGQILGPKIEKTSGNALYDQAALRAIVEANPFPPLPAEFKEPLLRVHLGFNYAADRG